MISWQHSRVYALALATFMGIFMFGYDTGLAGGLIALPSFQRDFGLAELKGDALANLKGRINSSLQGGCLIGSVFAAPICNWIGRRRCLMLNCVFFLLGASIMTATKTNVDMFIGGRIVVGLGVGAMGVACPTYVAEVSPRHIRGKIMGLFQVIIVVGVAVSYWIIYGLGFTNPNNSRQWRIAVSLQLVPVGLMMLIIPLLRESPRWLIVKHRHAEALSNLAWIRKTDENDPETRAEFDEIVVAVMEEEIAVGDRSWREIFLKGNRMRFVIAIGIFTFQQWSGQNSISYYAPDIFNKIGLHGTSVSLLASGIYGTIKIIFTIIFVLYGVESIGRRWAFVYGLSAMSLFLWAIGALFAISPPEKHPEAEEPNSASIAMAALIYVYVIPYCFSVGPVPWIYCSEIFNNRTRSYGLACASACQWAWNLVVTRYTPNMIHVLKHGGIFFFFAGINIVGAFLAYFLPETKGIGLEQMDIIFGLVSAETRAEHMAAAREPGTSALLEETSHEDKAESPSDSIENERKALGEV